MQACAGSCKAIAFHGAQPGDTGSANGKYTTCGGIAATGAGWQALLIPVLAVCSNVAGATSSAYPCICGTTTAATTTCQAGEVCTASSDSDGVCQAQMSPP